MSVSARVRALIEPLVAAEGLELFDLEQVGPVLRVTVDREGGVSIDDITKTTRAISRAIDEPTTLTTPSASAPRCLASWSAASVSAVSPLCEMQKTSVSFGSGSWR